MINHQTSISHLGLNASGCSSPFRYVALLAFTLIFLGAAMPGSAAEPVSAKIDQGQVVIDVGGKPFTTYIFGEALKRPSFSASLKKPYFYPVIGPKSGKTVTLETMPPYPHHNSLWFGCDRVNGVDYWSVNLKVGRIVSQGAKLVEAAGERAVFTDECLWTPTGKDPIIRDTRKVTITAPSPALRFIDFDITLDPLTDLTIQKSNHSLFSGRMTPELCVTDHEKKSRGGVLINAEGKSSEKDTFGVLSPWMDFYGARDGVTEGMAILENPDNRWYPSPWFTRDYGFFSPTPMQWLKGGAIKIPKGEKFTLKYRVIVHAGDTKEAGIADLFKQYAPNAASKPLTASPDIDLTPAPAPKPKEAKPAVKAAAKPAEGKNAPEGVTGLVQENQPQPMQLAQAKAKAAKPAAKPAVGVQDAAAEEEAASKASPGGKGKAAVAEKTASMADLDKIIDDLKKYNYGQSRKATVAIEQLVLASYQSPADRKKLSDRLIELLKSDASYACK
ncbi:MAG: PmoA family protein [Candidatus Sumerlaeota bacterium]|nr:PmoA family protein [Candidatus Sumerlaeota bacterium]